MRWLRSSSEAEMVALFLRTELPSDRWKDDLRALLGRAGLPDRVITAPDLGDDAENQARLRLLTEHRGYGTRTEIFDGFPDDVRWQWIAISSAEFVTAAAGCPRCRASSSTGPWVLAPGAREIPAALVARRISARHDRPLRGRDEGGLWNMVYRRQGL